MSPKVYLSGASNSLVLLLARVSYFFFSLGNWRSELKFDLIILDFFLAYQKWITRSARKKRLTDHITLSEISVNISSGP